MRSILALLAMTTPALAHTGTGPHLHEAQGFWLAAVAFAFGLALTLRVLRKPARAEA